MRQVPTGFHIIVGDGRLSRHWAHYMSLLHIPHSVFRMPLQNGVRTLLIPENIVSKATHVWILVKDSAIEETGLRFRTQYSEYIQNDLKIFHASGANSFLGIEGVHPLMTFGEKLYSKENYLEIPLVTDSREIAANPELLGGFTNPIHYLSSEKKALYHALCVSSGNFSSMLWNEVAARFADRLNLPAEVLAPYLRKVLSNFENDGAASLTGPLIRDDRETVNKNLKALEDDALKPVYETFVNLWRDKNADRT